MAPILPGLHVYRLLAAVFARLTAHTTIDGLCGTAPAERVAVAEGRRKSRARCGRRRHATEDAEGAGRLAPPELEGSGTLFCLTTERVLGALDTLSVVDICVVGNADGGAEILLLPPLEGNAALPITPGVVGVRGETPPEVLLPVGRLDRLLGTTVVKPLASLFKLALEYARALPPLGVLLASLSTDKDRG